MGGIPRWAVDELFTKYELHPSLFDIYVEGEFDQDFLDQFMATLAQEASISVLSIDAIEIPSEKLTEFGLTLGSNKSRVIALAMLLEEKFGKRPSNITCLIDADMDRVLDSITSLHYVDYTDFTCMEMYALNIATLKRFITFTCNLKDVHVDKVFQLATLVLPCQFLARAVSLSLGLGTPVPHFTSGLKSKKDLHSFDEAKYLKVFVDNAKCPERKTELSDQLLSLRAILPKDLRHKANGHDFISLLFEYLWRNDALKLKSKDGDVVSFGGRILATALQFENLSNENLFMRIKDAASGATHMHT